ncbi:MAG: DUF5666 domain-containing protein, partial [Pseudomonadales bacterium]
FTFDTGIGGSGGLIGEIDGFGSIFVNDLEMDTTDADVFIEGEPASESELEVGHYVVVVGDLGSLDADEVYYRSNLKGPVSAPPLAIDPLTGRYELTVMGQKVLTVASTRFNGILVGHIVEGDELEVSGAIDSTGQVIATYIELENMLSEYKAIGFVASLDTGAMTFDLGGLAVDYSSAALSEFEGASVAEGQLVEVRLAPADFTSPPASALAAELELLPEPVIGEGAEVEVEGYINGFVSATEFSVNGIAVTTNGSTLYENGGVTSLGPDVKVEVEGIANASGVIVADEIEFKTDNAIRVEGQVTAVSVVTANSGTVSTAQGVTFEIRASTEFEDDSSGGVDPFTMNDLMMGDRIGVRGILDGTTVVAVELEREDADTSALLRGPVTEVPDPATNTVEILGNTLNEQSGITEYQDVDENTVTRTQFYNLLQVDVPLKAEWDDFGSLSDTVDSLSLEEDD